MTLSSNTVVLFSGPEPLGKAFAKVFEIYSNLSGSNGYELICLGNPDIKKKQPVFWKAPFLGLSVIWDEKDFFEKFSELIGSGASGMVAVSIFKDSSPPWKKLSDPRQVNAFSSCCEWTGIEIEKNIIPALKELQFKTSVNSGVKERAYRAACAINLKPLLDAFSHSGKHDITNAFIGPLRMLTKANSLETPNTAWWKTASKNWTEFKKVVNQISKNKAFFGILGSELSATIKNMGACTNFSKKIVPDNFQIESLSLLLTEIRKESGYKPTDPTSKKGGKLKTIVCPTDPSPDPYRILVVDDWSVSWYPVLKVVAKKINKKTNRSVIIEFSDDGHFVHLSDGIKNLDQFLPDYDLILLDVYLPGTKGTDILAKIRQTISGIPIIMWTTSLDEEISSKSVTANGYIFKKTATCEEIAETIISWIPSGRGKRTISLPNPFFDHNIRTKEIRDCAIGFTHYCLKLLDSFHALDDRYFKFFNDHGGRHIIGTLGILEKLLRPFLFETSSVHSIFSENPKQREIEILCLYIGVLCHEIGMFPMKTEKYQHFNGDDLFISRKQHALRGLRILSNDDHQSPDFRKLMTDLERIGTPFACAAVAALTVYHSRTLQLNEKTNFCELSKEAEDVIVDQQSKTRFSVTPADIRKDLNNIANLLSDFKKEEQQIDRLKRLCAILRFADALDIDHTRIPADFLLHHEARSVIDDRENFKRQVLGKVIIDRGRVSIVFRIEKPNLHQLKTWLEEVDGDLFKECEAMDQDMLSDPWAEKNVEKVFGIRKPLDKILEAYFRNSLRDIGKKSIKPLSWATALSVCGELIDEYSAIGKYSEDQEKNLNGYIKLGDVIWEKPKNLSHFTIPTNVPHFPKLKVIEDGGDGAILDTEEKLALLIAFNDMFSGIKVKGIQRIHVNKISGGFSSAKTLIVKPDGFQPRFCKIDKFEDIEQEYKGYRNLSCLQYPADNLIHDVRLSKYRDKGVFLGSFIGEITKPPRTIESVVLDLLCNGRTDIDKAKTILETFLNEVLLKNSLTNLQEESLLNLYKTQINRIEKNLTKLKENPKLVRNLPNSHCSGDYIDKELLGNWKKVKDLWEHFKRLMMNFPVSQGIIHGDLHPRNILLKQGFIGSSQFVLIDMAGTSYGHPLYDAAFLEGWLLTTTTEELMKNCKTKPDFNEAQSLVSEVSKIIFPCFENKLYREVDRELKAKFQKECKIARLIRDFLVIGVFPSGFSPEAVNQILEWTWKRLETTLDSLH